MTTLANGMIYLKTTLLNMAHQLNFGTNANIFNCKEITIHHHYPLRGGSQRLTQMAHHSSIAAQNQIYTRTHKFSLQLLLINACQLWLTYRYISQPTSCTASIWWPCEPFLPELRTLSWIPNDVGLMMIEWPQDLTRLYDIVFWCLGPLPTRPKSRDHEIERAQKESIQRPSQDTSKIMY